MALQLSFAPCTRTAALTCLSGPSPASHANKLASSTPRFHHHHHHCRSSPAAVNGRCCRLLARATPFSSSSTTHASSSLLVGTSTTSPVPAPPGPLGNVGFGFSAGGLLFPYFVGIAMALRDEFDLLGSNNPVAGASAGSLIAATCKSGISESDLVQATLLLARDCRERGTRFRLRGTLRRTLEEVLPHDIHERCSGSVFVAVTQLWPKLQPRLISQFHSRQHLIETLLVSCHIPWYFDGSLVTGYGATLAFDGGLTNFIPVPPNCTTAVRVACFASSELRLFKGIGMSMDTFEDWPHDMNQMIRWALEPASDDMLLELVSKGKRDARAWAEKNGIQALALTRASQLRGPGGVVLP